MYAQAVIALGSNQGDRLASFAAALRELSSEPDTAVLRVSSVYGSDPWGVSDQPPFANAVALISFDGEADALLGVLKDIEARLGRAAGERFGPRPIDLDILLFRDEEWDSPELTIPHPRMLERDFVVTPLLEMLPAVTLPDGRAPDRAAAKAGRVVAVLGEVPGFEAITGPFPPEDDPEARIEAAMNEIETGSGPVPVPTPEQVAGLWAAVGPQRLERNSPNSSTDFDLLFYETILKEAGIPTGFAPHRPNEGFSTYWGISQAVRLMVPEDRADEARRLIAEVSRAPRE
ncbi:MAG TPA: 2-amino-4-hydroxy-6-hydroxymethyldihydropteridine diphosphokinase [Coriobacteriia bacterium]